MATKSGTLATKSCSVRFGFLNQSSPQFNADSIKQLPSANRSLATSEVVRSLKDYCKSLFGTSVYKQRLLKNGEILSDNHALTDLSSAEILGPEEEWILVPACFWLILQSLQVKYQSQLQTRTSLCLVCLCMPCIFCSWCVVRLAELTFPLAVFPRIDVLKEWFQSVAV